MSNEEKEKKRKKQLRKMSKLLATVWELDAAFHNDLGAIGRKIDDESSYKFGKTGWTDFARDLGAVYTKHIQGKTELAASAKKHLQSVQEILSNVHDSLAKVAATADPDALSNNNNNNNSSTSKKRKSDPSVSKSHTKKPKTELEARKVRAMDQLRQFIAEKGGNPTLVQGFTASVTQRKSSTDKFDVNFFNAATGQRFRSMLQVGRHLRLVDDSSSSTANRRTKKRGPTTQREEAEKKKIRRELERLRKAHTRATKALDDWDTTGGAQQQQQQHPDALLAEDSTTTSSAATFPLAAARQPDYTCFPGFPTECTPDILQAWDFLCTFQRPLALDPMQLEDFVEALSYQPPTDQTGDDITSAPVYVAEAHLALLKMLFSDRSSDDWWWSILETDETEGIKTQAAAAEEEDTAILRFDLAAALSCPEDPLITQSWLRILEKRETGKVKNAVKEALKVVSNKWIAAYLRKCLKVPNTDRAVSWIVRRCRQARPDLASTVSQNTINDARAKAVEVAAKHMGVLSQTAPCVADDDVVSEWEEEDDDDSDDEEEGPTAETTEALASALPPKPLPTFVDMLLPPEKPSAFSEFLNPFTWPHLVGATASRVIHRKKRVLNETDDSLRESSGLPHLTSAERREREAEACSRFLSECFVGVDMDTTIKHLCSGGNYLDLSPRQRLCILRLLIEASYDTVRVHEIVTSNFKQKVSAEKALDVEQRRAKRELKEKAAADEQAARQRLANDAKAEFIEARKEEIRQLNAKSQEFSEDVIDSLTEEDIVEFDDDFKADFEALPAAESFSKHEVSQMIVRLQEEVAFDTNSLTILSMDELVQMEQKKLTAMKVQFEELGGESALMDDSMDRETIRSIDRLKRAIERSEVEVDTLPSVRESALEQLTEAMEDGTIKALRTAYATAKKAILVGHDEESGGVWAIDEVRAVALELEKAKQNKRVLDAQRDLVAKRNRCFIRTDPIGRDRLGNRFWTFPQETSTDVEQVWTQTEYSPVLDEAVNKTLPGCVDLSMDPKRISFGASDREEDFSIQWEDPTLDQLFSRREYHSTGFTAKRASFFWGCHATEEALRSITKSLSAQVECELDLKTKLKESLEHSVTGSDNSDKYVDSPSELEQESQPQSIQTEGDESCFAEAKRIAESSDEFCAELFLTLKSGIGAAVRIREIVDETTDPPIARYQNSKVSGWKEEVKMVLQELNDGVNNEVTPQKTNMKVVSWRVVTHYGKAVWLSAADLVESITRFHSWSSAQGYFEHDAAFFAFRNHLGRHCGRVTDAPYSASPSFFAKSMIKREAELYPKLKSRSFENSWGGQSGARAMWTNSMRDYAYDFETVKQGLSTLEDAFFQLTRGFSEYKGVDESPVDVGALLEDKKAVFDIELESMDTELPGLWNSPASRAVFLHIVDQSATTGFLALCLDLLCRNALKYLQVHKLLHISPAAAVPTVRVTRRMNAWQQQQPMDAW